MSEGLDERLKIRAAPFGLRGWVGNVLSTIYGLYCLPYVPIWFALGLLAWPLGLAHAFVHWLIQIFLEIWLITFGVKVVIDGAEHIDPNQTYVVAANHRSWLDAVTLITAFKVGRDGVPPRRLYFVIKRSLLFIPGFGLYMLWARYIPVVRGQAGKGKGSNGNGKAKGDNSGRVQAAVEHLKLGKSILIFPEGTRSPDHKFRRFKRGAAQMAIQAGVPVLPVCFSNTGQLYPKGKTYIRPGTVRIEFLPPISPEGHTNDTLTQAVYDVMTPRYRLEWDGPPLQEQPELFALAAPEHSRFKASRRGGSPAAGGDGGDGGKVPTSTKDVGDPAAA
jgi:1-acyl-sn-glycerol-3-phosphate acyltransferase